jgi:hypothetical protein
MKTAFIMINLTIVLFVCRTVRSQGTLYVSTLGETPTGNMEIGNDSWIAQAFYTFATDPNTYDLNAIQLLLDPASGSPSGLTVSIYNSNNNAPETDLGALTLNGSINPSVGGTFSYTASGITISPGTTYFVVLTAATPTAEGAYEWSASRTGASSGNWNITDVYYSSVNGSSWTQTTRQDIFQMAIYATPIPESSPWSLALLGGGILFLFGTLNQRRHHESHR